MGSCGFCAKHAVAVHMVHLQWRRGREGRAQKTLWTTGARDTRRPNAVKITPKRTVSSRSDTTGRGTVTTTVCVVGSSATHRSVCEGACDERERGGCAGDDKHFGER